MLSLASARWSELQHAYGAATDVPRLLEQLATLPDSGGERQPWFSLWSALAHQGDVYDASFAAVPHVVQALASAPLRAGAVYFQFPAWVEVCRIRNGVDIPGDLSGPYFAALSRLPSLVAAASAREWDADFLQCALSAIAAAKGAADIAEIALELTPPVAAEMLEWLNER